MLLRKPVSIIAGSLRCSPGSDRAAIVRALVGGHGVPATITLEDFPGRDFPYFPMEGMDANGEGDERERLYAALDACVAEALEQAGLDAAQRAHTGLFLGSSSVDIGATEQQYRRALAAGETALALPRQSFGDPARHLRDKFCLGAGEYTLSTACTSSANALLLAAQAIRAGQMAAAVVVGVECFNRTTLLGFDSLQLLSHSGYRPFDLERSGMVLGEGVGAVVVADLERCPPHNAWQGVSFLGGANGCDPEGLTCSSAGSMARVMAQALATTGTSAEELSLLKAHGTGSENNDKAEAQAMRQLFGENLPPLTSIKGALGHTLGACGVVELIALVSCLQAGTVPATCGFSKRDPALGCLPLTRGIPFSSGRVMLNYFGFGGNNTSLILEVHEL